MSENSSSTSEASVKTSIKKSVQQSVQQTVETAAKLAPKNLQPMIKEIPNRIVERADQVLLGLSHTKDSVPLLLKQALTRIEGNPADLVGRVSRSVLERAETIRKQLIEKAEEGSESILNQRWVPDWLVVRTAADAVGADARVNTETVVDDEKVSKSAAPVAAEAAPIKATEVSVKAAAKKSPSKKSPKAKAGEQMPLAKVAAKAKKSSRSKKA